MPLIIILGVMIAAIIIWRLKQKKELILKLTWAERIYTAFIYLMSLFLLFYGGSKIKTWLEQFQLNEFIEASLLFIVLAIILHLIVTVWMKILPKKVIDDI